MNTTRARLKMALSGLSVSDFMSRCVSIKSAIADNSGVFVSPNPTLLVLDAAIQLLSARQIAVKNVGGKDNTFLRNQARVALHNLMRALAEYVAGVADGDADIILLSGFEIVDEKNEIGLVAPPNTFKRKVDGLGEGEIYLSWQGVPPANGYVVSLAAVVNGVISTWGDSIKAKGLNHTFTGLTSGQLYAMRVASLSATGQGVWSIVVTYRPQ